MKQIENTQLVVTKNSEWQKFKMAKSDERVDRASSDSNENLSADEQHLMSSELSHSLSEMTEAASLDGAEKFAIQPHRIVENVGPYRIIREIGEGGMGTVYEAEQFKPVRRKVAIKVIKAGRASQRVIARFEAEQQALALMDHPTIARIFDAGKTELGQPYFAMELIDGVPFTQYCDEKSLGIEERLSLFCQICDGIQHAHQKGVIHRDLKPGNILVTEYDGRPVPKIIDFGLAKALQDSQPLTDGEVHTEFGQILGTIMYMSPEQAGLNELDVDTRSDIYTLGIILYELLTGLTPLDKNSIQKNAVLKILEMVREVEVAKPSSRISDDQQHLSSVSSRRLINPRKLTSILSGELDWIVMKSLDKNRSRRYASASALADDIHRFLKGEAVVARPPTKTYLIGKFIAKNRVGVAFTSAVLLLLGTTVVGTAYGFFRANAAEKVAVAQADRAETILGIVINSFASTDPRQGATGPMTAGDVLDHAKESLSESKLDDAGKSKLLSAIVTASIGLGKYSDAVEAGTAQLKLNQKLYGERDEASIRAMTDLAFAHYNNNNPEAALEIDQVAFKLAKQSLGKQHFETLRSMTNLGVSLFAAGQHGESIRLDEEALGIRRDVFGQNHLETLRSMSNLASKYKMVEPKRTDKSLELEQQVVRIRMEAEGAEHPDTLIAQNNLAATYIALKEWQKAYDLFTKVSRIRKRILGEDHPATLRTEVNLAIASMRLGSIEEALSRFGTTLNRLTEAYGPNHTLTRRTKNMLAKVYENSGQAKIGMEKTEKVRLAWIADKLGIDNRIALNLLDELIAEYGADQPGLGQQLSILRDEILQLKKKVKALAN